MNREQQEMALWRRVFEQWYAREDYESDTCGNIADAAVAEFRKRYPQQPADDATGKAIAALLDDIAGDSAFSGFGESMQSRIYEAGGAMRLAGRRVSPIVKPQEPTT